MKKLILVFAALLAIINLASAQKAQVQTAYNYLRYDDLDKAKEAIDQAASNESTIGMAKTWYYRGSIYQAIYESKKPEFNVLKPGSLQEAYKSYEKTIELDSKKEYKDDLDKRMAIIGSQFLNEGVDKFRDKDYPGAVIMFESSADISKKYLNKTDTLAIYNAALAAEKAKDYVKAKKYYQQVIDLNYQGAKGYNFLSKIYMAEKDTANALVTLQAGRQKYPADANLMLDQLNIYLVSGRDKEALGMIDQAIALDPNNANLYSVKGNINDKAGNQEVAIASYKKAIELNPQYFDAYYNLGALIFNQGVEMVDRANKLPPSKQAEFDKLKTQFDAKFGEAKPYFEKAYQLNPKDLPTINSLKQLYLRLGDMPKAEEMKKAMEAVK